MTPLEIQFPELIEAGGWKSLGNAGLGARKGRKWDWWISVEREVWDRNRKSYFHETLSLGPGINKKDIGVVIKSVLAKNKGDKKILEMWEMGIFAGLFRVVREDPSDGLTSARDLKGRWELPKEFRQRTASTKALRQQHSGIWKTANRQWGWCTDSKGGCMRRQSQWSSHVRSCRTL